MMHAFPKIFAIGTDYISQIFAEEVEVTEKVDGSQFDFIKTSEGLHMRSKGTQQFKERSDKLFQQAVDYAVSIEDRIPENTSFYCEYLQKPKHNVLKYNRIPKNHLILFGASFLGGTFCTDFQKFAEVLDLETVPVIYKGKINSADELLKMLETESCLGGTKVEGIVVKNYSRAFLLGGQAIPLMMGKFVSEAFKEVHREHWGKENTGKGKWQTFVDSFRTEARWEKSIQVLKENGILENSPRDIGSLIKQVQIDIEEEEKEAIKNFLWKEFKGDIMRKAAAGLPEWYKERLLKSSFQSKEEKNVAN